MPEVWVNLNIDEALVSEVHGLDMRDFYGREADKVLEALDLKTLDDMHTETYDEWKYYYETVPEEYRKPWDPNNENWTSTKYGVEWADRLKRHLESLSDFKGQWPYDHNERGLVLETLSEFRGVMEKANKLGSDFRISFGE